MEQTPEKTLAEVLQRLSGLHPKKIDLSLGRINKLLKALGHPERKLPPVIHVAGTNGKGSVIAYLRAIFEAAELKPDVYTSPHLVSFRERIRLQGKLIGEAPLIDVLDRAERANAGGPITFFEITTAAAFLAFAETPADILLLEVGLGGRLDATNVIDKPLVSLITPVGLDHAAFLGTDLAGVAREKAGICKKGVPVVIGNQPPAALESILKEAGKAGAKPLLAGKDWRVERTTKGFIFKGFGKTFGLPDPALPGPYQADNAAMAIAALLAQEKFPVSETHMARGLETASWPARFQALDPEKLGFPKTCRVWLDGGHNPLAGQALARVLAEKGLKNIGVVFAMMEGKDCEGFLVPLAPFIKTLIAIPIPGQEAAQAPEKIASAAKNLGIESKTAKNLKAALAGLPKGTGDILITGSLYLAGHVLAQIGEYPA